MQELSVEASTMMTVPEAAALLRIGKNRTYQLVKSGDLPHVRFGEQIIRIPRQALLEYINREAKSLARGA